MQIETFFAGSIDVPRSAINLIQFGMRPRKVIYHGPQSEADWLIKDHWRFESKRYVADGTGTLAKTFDIPGSFALRFRVSWRNTPNLRVYFADDLLETSGKADRYFANFGSGGFELKRQQRDDGVAPLPMASIPRDPSSFPDSSLEVELRVDRKLAMVHVYLNGEFVEKYHDSLNSAPTGQGIMFESKVSGEDAQFLDSIDIREWEPAADRHRSEPRGDESEDVVITRSSDRGKGRILGMKTVNGESLILYKGPHTSEPVELPVDDVSTLFFQRAAEREPAKRSPLTDRSPISDGGVR
jgi:hypothetical protein